MLDRAAELYAKFIEMGFAEKDGAAMVDVIGALPRKQALTNDDKTEDRMIRVKKIAHASYEMPDVDKQIEYYTEILGLTVIGKDKDAVYLASTVDHHSVVLRQGAQAQCVRIGFQIGPDDDLDAFERQVQGHGVKTERKKDPEPSIADMVTFEDPKGTIMEVFKRDAFSGQRFPTKGMVPHKLGHVAFHVHRREARHQVLLRRARLPRVRLDGGLLLVPALRARPPHHQPDGDRLEPALPHGVRAARLGAPADRLRLSQPQRLQAHLGARAGTASATICSPITARPNGLITELFAELDRMNEDLGYFEPRPWHRDRPQRPKVALTNGTFVKTAANGDQLFGTYAGTTSVIQPPTPIGVFEMTGTLTFTGGTGRFTGAAGTTTMSGIEQADFSQTPITIQDELTMVGEISY